MEAELINEQTALLNQIINEVKAMDIEEKKKLLTELRKDKILQKVQSLDAVKGSLKADAMTDEEADAYISQQRKFRYEQSKT